MKNKYFLSLFFAAICFVFSSSAKAQKIIPKKTFPSYWEVGINSGSSLFFGDVKQNPIIPVSTDNNEWRLGGSFMAGYQFNYIFGLRGQALYGQLAGTKRAANYFFESDYIEFNVNTTINLNNLLGKNRTDRFATAYLLAGIGITNYNSIIYTLSTGIEKRRIGFGSGSGIKGRTLEGILVGGVGVNFRINNHFIVNFETANRIMNSDEMDGWVKGFKYDVYNYTSIGLSYRFGNRKAKSPQKPPVVTHQNMQEVPPVPSKSAAKKKPCTVEIQPVMPPATSNTAEAKNQQTTVVTEHPPRKHAVKTIEKVTTPPRPVLKFSVQIRAKYGQSIPLEWLSKKYGLPQSEIRENKHNGYYIYTVGSYLTYEQARAHRDQLRSRNGIGDAFVVVFKNGHRLDKIP